MAKQTKLSVTITAEGTRGFLEKLAQDLEDAAIPGTSSANGNPTYVVWMKRIAFEEVDL